MMSGPSSAMGPASSPPWASLCSANGGQSHHQFLGATISVLYCVQRCPGNSAPECTPPVMHISSRRRPRLTAIITLLAPSISVPHHVQRGTGMFTPECTCPVMHVVSRERLYTYLHRSTTCHSKLHSMLAGRFRRMWRSPSGTSMQCTGHQRGSPACCTGSGIDCMTMSSPPSCMRPVLRRRRPPSRRCADLCSDPSRHTGSSLLLHRLLLAMAAVTGCEDRMHGIPERQHFMLDSLCSNTLRFPWIEFEFEARSC